GVLSGTFTSQTCAPTVVTISSSTNNLNLWNYLVSNGLSNGGAAGTWYVTIASGVVIGSTSTSTPALDTGSFPAGSTLNLVNNGVITGRGGPGGTGGSVTSITTCSSGLAGGVGGPALQLRIATVVTNNGSIWGGGGGGGGGSPAFAASFAGGG